MGVRLLEVVGLGFGFGLLEVVVDWDGGWRLEDELEVVVSGWRLVEEWDVKNTAL